MTNLKPPAHSARAAFFLGLGRIDSVSDGVDFECRRHAQTQARLIALKLVPFLDGRYLTGKRCQVSMMF